MSAADLQQLQARSLQLLQHHGRHPAASPYAGPHRSTFRGQGLELADLRPYQPGDDIRHIDWRATARSGKPTTKVFLEERQRNVHIVVDRGPAMHFGTRHELKARTAARAAAVCAFTALAHGDEVSGTVVDAGEQRFTRTRSLDGVLRLLRAAAAPPATTDSRQPSTGTPRRLLHHLNRALERRSIVILISDFSWLAPDLAPPLSELQRHHYTLALRIIDPAEETLADVGRIRLVSPVTGALAVVDTGDPELRDEYARTMAQRAADQRRLLARAGIRLTDVHTNSDLFTTLAGALRL